MKKFKTLTAIAAPLMLSNIDTDTIIPMKRITQSGRKPLGYYAFEPLRYIGDADTAVLNPEFVLNKPEYQGAKILITGENFGCGSSRETAVYALVELDIRCVIGASFGDIFFNNCFQNGVLPIQLPLEILKAFAQETTDGAFTVNLETKTVTSPSNNIVSFAVNEFRRNCLLEGLDDIGMTLKRDAEIAAFQKNDQAQRPWIYQIPVRR